LGPNFLFDYKTKNKGVKEERKWKGVKVPSKELFASLGKLKEKSNLLVKIGEISTKTFKKNKIKISTMK
jgi:hypothetical protein